MTTDRDMSKLVHIVADGLRVWVKRGEVALTEDQIFERARNIVTGVIVSFELRALPPLRTYPEWRTPLIADAPHHHMYGCCCGSCPPERTDVRVQLTAAPPAKPVGHSWSCKCDRCDTYQRSVQT